MVLQIFENLARRYVGKRKRRERIGKGRSEEAQEGA